MVVHLPEVVAPLCLAGATISYGASTLLLSRDVARSGVNPLLLRSYQAGLVGQGLGFVLSFVARSTLPLLLVQATVAASVAVSAVAGWALRRWRLEPPDLLALTAVVAGIAAAGAASTAGAAVVTSAWPVATCLAVTVLALAVDRAAGVTGGPGPGATGLGAMAGLAFGGSAVGARVLAADPGRAVQDLTGVLAAVLVVLGLVGGQILLTRAFAQASVAGPVSGMYVVATTWPGAVGLLWLGDLLDPGAWWLAAIGVAAALAGTARLSRLESLAAPADVP